ncbi:MAG: TolC family protein, partial [Spirosoma sp.]|nr:TolC family protein [Spirosoma sp.]
TPELVLLRSQTTVADRQIEVDRARLLPSFSLGYFNQSLIGIYNVGGQDVYYGGGKRFQGFIAGIAVPLFTGPLRARVTAARLGEQLSQAQLRLNERNLSGERDQLLLRIRQAESSLTYYEQTGLPTARLLVEKGGLAFRAGEIGYLDYFQALSGAYQTRIGYLDALNQYNQAVINLEQLLGLP